MRSGTEGEWQGKDVGFKSEPNLRTGNIPSNLLDSVGGIQYPNFYWEMGIKTGSTILGFIIWASNYPELIEPHRNNLRNPK